MFIFKLGSLESGGNHSLASECRFKNPKIYDLHYFLKLKTRASCVFVSLIPGWSRQEMYKSNRNE